MSKKKSTIITASIVAVVIIVDFITKALVHNLMALGQSIPLIKGVLHLTYIRNEGAAFGMLSEHRWVFMVVSVVAILAIGVYLFIFSKEGMLSKVGLALIVGGGIGNMIDRISLGYVIDMIDFCPFEFWVWIFNVADSCVCVGAGIVILSLILDLTKESKRKKES
ncbi:MAG: signal peptidase II [Clostridia bacterium]|nr:signal peptidase II [Clostridia bacterium]